MGLSANGSMNGDRAAEAAVDDRLQDRIGTDCIGFPVATARTGLWVVAPRGQRIGNTRTQRHVRAPGIVMADP